MPLDKNAILFASLVGSKVAESLPSFKKIEKRLDQKVIPPLATPPFVRSDKVGDALPNFGEIEKRIDQKTIPPLATPPFVPLGGIGKKKEKKKKEKNTGRVSKADVAVHPDNQFFPLTFSHDGGKEFKFKYEPIINISGKNNLIKRKVSKVKDEDDTGNYTGTITERWSQDDWSITITGVLIGENEIGNLEHCYPKDELKQLLDFFKTPKRIKVASPPLELLGVNYIIIEDIEFPFSKGENMQAYVIKAYSDSSLNTLEIVEGDV